MICLFNYHQREGIPIIWPSTLLRKIGLGREIILGHILLFLITYMTTIDLKKMLIHGDRD